MKNNQITEPMVKVFEEEVKYWIEFFGLLGWEVQTYQALNRKDRAWCSVNKLQDRMCQIGIATEWNSPTSDFLIRQCAFHEVCELLTMRFFLLAISRSISLDSLEEENHNIIRTLENSVFSVFYKLRFEKEKKNQENQKRKK